MPQKKLFQALPVFRLNVGDNSMPLESVVDAFEQRLLIPAPFQRDTDVWDKQKRIKWAETLSTSRRIWGTFCIYRVIHNGLADGSLFLADGYQRISQTCLILQNPESFGLDISGEQLAFNLKYFQITVQYDEFDSHDQGFERFQLVNLGTALHPADYCKGYLTQLETHLDLYKIIPEIVEKVDARVGTRYTTSNRNRRLVSRRGSFALFYQYASETNQSSFWRYATPRVQLREKQIEQHLRDFLISKTDEQILAMLNNFQNYLNEVAAIIEQEVLKKYSIGYALPQTVFRALLHLGIYRKNNHISVSDFVEAIAIVLNLSQSRPGQLLWQDDSGKMYTESIAMQDLKSIITVCRIHGISLEKEKRSRIQKLKAGYHNSHFLPFIEFGEGETFPEPALLNRARGANPVESEGG